MAAETPAKSGESNEAVASRLAQLSRKLDQASAATASAKNISRVMTVLVVIAAIIGVWLLISPVMGAFKNTEPYQAAFEIELKERIIPRLEEELKSEDFQSVLKDVKDSVVTQLKERETEIFGAVDEQLRTFIDSMSQWGTDQLETRRTGIQEYLVEQLIDVAPDLQDPDKSETIIANAAGAMQNATSRIVNEYLGEHQRHLADIETQINQFPIPDDIAGMSDSQLSDELVQTLGTYATLVFRGSINPETRSFLREVSAENQ